MMLTIFKLIISLILPQLAGAIGAFFTFNAVKDWYPTLNKPDWTPPSWVFGPVWTILYFLMGIACFLIWNSDDPTKKSLLNLYFLQLVFNVLWSAAFFGARSPILGVMVILPLWAMILACVIQFHPVSAWASYLMIPYLLWVTFATALNISIWRLN